MQKGRLHSKKLKAFSLVEILLAVSLFSFLVLGFGSALSYTLDSTKISSYKTKAIFLMDEGLEAVRSIRNDNYAALVDGTYGLSNSTGKWLFIPTQEAIGAYKRTIQITPVDANTKQIISTVTWPTIFGVNGSVSTSMYLSDINRVVPLTNWNSPILAHVLNLPGNHDGWKVQYNGDYAYLLRQGSTPNVYTISTVGSPTVLNSATFSGTLWSIHMQGNHAFVTSTDNSMELTVRTAVNGGVGMATFYNAPGNSDARSVFATTNRAYIGRSFGTDKEFMVLDVTSRSSTPTLLGSIDLSADVIDIVVNGNYAYVITSGVTPQLIVLNISNPASITTVSTLNLPLLQTPNTVTYIGNKVIIGSSNGYLYIYDVTNPTTTPTFLSAFLVGGSVQDIDVDTTNNLVFAVGTNSIMEFQVLDISNPLLVVRRSFVNTAEQLNGVVYDSIKNQIYAGSIQNGGEFIIITNQGQ